MIPPGEAEGSKECWEMYLWDQKVAFVALSVESKFAPLETGNLALPHRSEFTGSNLAAGQRC